MLKMHQLDKWNVTIYTLKVVFFLLSFLIKIKFCITVVYYCLIKFSHSEFENYGSLCILDGSGNRSWAILWIDWWSIGEKKILLVRFLVLQEIITANVFEFSPANEAEQNQLQTDTSIPEKNNLNVVYSLIIQKTYG